MHPAPIMRPEPVKTPDWFSQFPGLEEFWSARLSTTTSTEKFFSWVYQYEWNCDLSISATFTSDPDERGKTGKITYGSLKKVAVISPGRENKKAVAKEDGTWGIGPDENFNKTPRPFGKIPDAWLATQKMNPCVAGSEALAYFDGQYTYSDLYIGSTGLDDDPITDFQVIGVNPKAIKSKQISSITDNDSRHFYVTYTARMHVLRSISIFPAASVFYGSYINIDKNKVWPGVIFGGYPLANDWEGSGNDGFARKDSKQPSINTVKTSVSIDGVKIPAGTKMSPFDAGGGLNGFSENAKNLANISVQWTRARLRDL